MPQAAPTYLNYWEESAPQWSRQLEAIKNGGTDETHIFIPWGVHESVQGIRDFSKASRLRLEKFLGLAHSIGITVRATVGFLPRRESIPSWALALGDHSALVPAALWRAIPTDLSLTRLPSLHDEEFFGPFLEFLADTFALLSLYRFPEGPLVGVDIDWGIYAHDLGLTAVPTYMAHLQKRYEHGGLLNLRYQSTFRDFSSATSMQGIRTMFDKRPWLLAHDYKFCREQMLEERAQGVFALRTVEPLVDLAAIATQSSGSGAPPGETEWVLRIDPTLLEGPARNASLFAPMGIAHAQAVGVLRLWEYLLHQAATNNVGACFLESLQGSPAPAPVVSVLSGRYLCRQRAEVLSAWADQGTRIHFPLGLPQYDENLLPLAWKPTGVVALGEGLQKIAWGRGTLSYQAKPVAPGPDLWKEIGAVT